jgi:hypothetical protein
MAWRCGVRPMGPLLGSVSVMTLGLIPYSSSLTTFFCLHVAWLAGFADFVERLAGLVVRVCRPQSFWLFVKCFLARVRATSLICDTLQVGRLHLGFRTPPAACFSVTLLMRRCH